TTSGAVFVQAEDGIRAFHVTGVQTCALPIFLPTRNIKAAVDAVLRRLNIAGWQEADAPDVHYAYGVRYERGGKVLVSFGAVNRRSEERRVGDERRPQWYVSDLNS